MHGCPPNEIEAICTYLLQEKGLHTFVKLNPTLLGYEKVKALLEARGFDYIGIKEATFSKDLQYADATRMIGRLVERSSACGRKFGVKLSNTLGARNLAGLLPGEEMYMSGRALFPLTISLAARLAREFQGALPISFSGGACQWNAPEIFEAGIKPITVATDLLKPGGYLRLREIANGLEPLLEKDRKSGGIDRGKAGANQRGFGDEAHLSEGLEGGKEGASRGEIASPGLLRRPLRARLSHPPGRPGVHPPGRGRPV